MRLQYVYFFGVTEERNMCFYIICFFIAYRSKVVMPLLSPLPMLLCVRRLNISILFFIGVTEAFNNVLDYVFIAQEPSRNASVTSADQALHIFYLWLVTEALSMGNCSSR